MLDSTFFMSAAPRPVAVRACLGLVKSGPTGPLSSEIGALVDILRSRVPLVVAIAVENGRGGVKGVSMDSIDEDWSRILGKGGNKGNEIVEGSLSGLRNFFVAENRVNGRAKVIDKG